MFSLLCSKSTPGQLITVAVSINRVSGFQKGNLIRVLYDFRTALSTRYQCRFNTNKILHAKKQHASSINKLSYMHELNRKIPFHILL